MNPLRLATYVIAVVVLVLSHFLPDLSAYLLPISAALAGWATVHPADGARVRRGAGHATPGIMFALVFFGLAIFAGLLLPRFARADSVSPVYRVPGTLGCFNSDVCARVVVPVAIGGLNLATRSVASGVFAGGVGLGFDLWASRWYSLTPAVAIAASAASAETNYANIAPLLGVFRFAWVGAMVHVSPQSTPVYLLAGIDPLAVAGVFGR